MNGIGQGSFAPALASSLNRGCAVDGITQGICSANIGEVELNSLICQNNIAKMIRTIEDARKGAKDVVRLLESKQLRANTAKSRFMVIGSPQSRTKILKEAADNPIMMGDMIIENSKSKEYLGDQIYEATLDGKIPKAIERGDT